MKQIKKMDIEKIRKILKKHKKWLNSEGMYGKRADFSNINLSWFDLSEVDLCSANLEGANLSKANLQDSGLIKARLCKSNLSGTDLKNSSLYGADVSGANLQGTKFGNNLQGVKGMISINSSYPYESYGYMYNNKLRIRLGCFDQTVEEWENNFWNNDEEFSKDSPAGQNRLQIYKFMRDWLYANFPKLKK